MSDISEASHATGYSAIAESGKCAVLQKVGWNSKEWSGMKWVYIMYIILYILIIKRV